MRAVHKTNVSVLMFLFFLVPQATVDAHPRNLQTKECLSARMDHMFSNAYYNRSHYKAKLSDSAESKVMGYFFEISAGHTQWVEDSYYSIESVSLRPASGSRGFGLYIGHLEERHLWYKDEFTVICPTVQFEGKRGGATIGMMCFHFEEGEGPDGFLILPLPTLRFKAGLSRRLFVSFNFASDMFFFPVSCEATYAFDDPFSEASIGLVPFGDEDEFAIFYRIKMFLFERFLLAFMGTTRFELENNTFGVGVAMFLGPRVE